MAGTSEHISALVRSHAGGDDAAFYSVALQVAAREARQGHHQAAAEIKRAVDASRKTKPVGTVTQLVRPRRDLDDLVIALHPEVSLRDIVLPTPLAQQVARVLAEHRQGQRLREHGFVPAHRLLFEGPPGTGKTMTASVIAHELSMPLLVVRLDALMSKYMGETAVKLRAVFESVAERRGVYLFDEFDALGADRSSNDVGEARRILNSFLVFLEDADPDSIVVAATNHRGLLDRALFRRFDAVLSYKLPEPDQALAVVRQRLGALMPAIDWEELRSSAVGLSHADLVKAAESAAKTALMRGDTKVTAGDLAHSLDVRRAASIA